MEVVASIMSVIAALVILIGIITVFFLPTLIAWRVKNPNTIAIFIVNLFLGFTGLGWIVALAWAFVKPNTSKE